MGSENIVEGGCRCGNVRYTVDRDTVLSAHHCHCRDCQMTTGSGRTTFVMVPDAGLAAVAGEPKFFSVKGTSGTTVTRGFCADCGCPLYSVVEVAPGMKFVKASSLADASWVTPVSSFWTSSAQPWAPADTSIDGFERNPEM